MFVPVLSSTFSNFSILPALLFVASDSRWAARDLNHPLRRCQALFRIFSDPVDSSVFVAGDPVSVPVEGRRIVGTTSGGVNTFLQKNFKNFTSH